MSKAGKIYRLEVSCFSPPNNIKTTVDIYDNSIQIPDTENPEIISLTAADNPLQLSVIDNEESPFKVIKSTQLVIRFLSDYNVSMSTFATGDDNQFYVEAYNQTEFIFKGFLAMGDMREAYMPVPNVIELTATDNLGILKDVKLVDFNGNNPEGYHRIIEYIVWALKQTGLSLTVYAAFNIKRSEDVSDISIPGIIGQHFFNKIYLEARTFEDENNSSINCYDTIERILGFEATLFQWKGNWWIVRRDEIEDETRGLYVTQFTPEGVEFQNLGMIYFDKEIKKPLSDISNKIFFTGESTQVRIERAIKSLRLDYLYEIPKEIPANKSFTLGQFIANIGSDEKTFTIDKWTLKAGLPGNYISTDGTTATIHRKYDPNGYEKERYIVLTPRNNYEQGSVQPTYIESEPIPVHEKDKFTASIDWRLNQGISTGGGYYRLFRFVLNGDDGSWWILGRPSDTSGSDDTILWYNTNNWTTNTARGKTIIDFDTINEEEWQTITWEAPPIPVSGNLYIWLNQFNQSNVSADNKEIWYSNLNFEYIPFINGSYHKYRGQYFSTSQNRNLKATKKEQIFISDSPKKLFKGALFEFQNGKYVLANKFYNAAVFPAGPPDPTYIHPYGEIQLFDVWNQFRNEMRLFDYNIQGLDIGNNLIGLIHKYKISDFSFHNLNKRFTLLHFNHNLYLGESTGLLREVVDLSKPKDYSNLEFRYIDE